MQLIIFQVVLHEIIPAGYGILSGFHIILLNILNLCLQQRAKRVDIHMILTIKVIRGSLYIFLHFINFFLSINDVILAIQNVEDHLTLDYPCFIFTYVVLIELYPRFGEELFAFIKTFLNVGLFVNHELCVFSGVDKKIVAGASLETICINHNLKSVNFNQSFEILVLSFKQLLIFLLDIDDLNIHLIFVFLQIVTLFHYLDFIQSLFHYTVGII